MIYCRRLVNGCVTLFNDYFDDGKIIDSEEIKSNVGDSLNGDFFLTLSVIVCSVLTNRRMHIWRVSWIQLESFTDECVLAIYSVGWITRLDFERLSKMQNEQISHRSLISHMKSGISFASSIIWSRCVFICWLKYLLNYIDEISSSTSKINLNRMVKLHVTGQCSLLLRFQIQLGSLLRARHV